MKYWLTGITFLLSAASTLAENNVTTPTLTPANATANTSAPISVTIPINLVDEKGVFTSAGQVVVTESKYGLVFTPSLAGLPTGLHGFHIHENPSCAPKEKDGKQVAALSAGGHLDPQKTGKHGTPWGEGHLGDLPALSVDAEGKASQPVLAPRLKLSDIAGRSLMIHAGGDNHSDNPAPLGGGGVRLYCGVIPK